MQWQWMQGGGVATNQPWAQQHWWREVGVAGQESEVAMAKGTFKYYLTQHLLVDCFRDVGLSGCTDNIHHVLTLTTSL
jgi:hypothetical protein